MRKLQLDSVLLFILVIPVIMTYRISPGDTPFWLFGIIFTLLFTNIFVDLLHLNVMRYNRIKNTLLWCAIIAVIGSVFVSAIIVRHVTHPVYNIHDIVLQQEAAIRFLLDGKNPYAVTYFGTFLEQWNYSENQINPALYHFVMQPFYLLFALPFYFLSNTIFGYFDGRIPLIFLFSSILILAHRLIKNDENKRLFIILFAFNPAMFSYTLEGRSDYFMYAFLFAGFYLLHKKLFMLAGIPIALAFVTKQSAWPLFPLYFAYLFFHQRKKVNVLKSLIPFGIVSAVIIGPFLLWDMKAYIDSTVNYLSGSTIQSYPISGYGFGSLLHQFGFIKNIHAYYPFQIWQALFGLPALVALLSYLKKNPNVSRLILCYGILLFIFWYFSRYFNNSHLGYLSTIFLTAYFWPEEREHS